jgi:hypothetical protein
MQSNIVIKSSALVTALCLALLSYPAEAGTDTPRFAYDRPDVPNHYYLIPKTHPGWQDFNNGYSANTRTDTGSSDVPGAQYPDVRESSTGLVPERPHPWCGCF